MAQRGNKRKRLVDHVLERHVLAATPGAVGGQHGDRSAVVQARGDRLGAKP